MRIPDTLSLLTHGYDAGARIWRRVPDGARSAPMHLLGRRALLVRGREGVDAFYDDTRIARRGAMPAVVREPLFGHGSVHGLDGDAHRHRKAAFTAVAYDDAEVDRLRPLLEAEWRAEQTAWLAGGDRSVYDAAVGAYGRAVLRWAGTPGTAAARTRWSARLAQIVDGFGAPYSPAYLRAVQNRVRSDRHARRLVEAVRAGELHPASRTALAMWARHRDERGALLPARTAGVELQNCVRPMIAVARFAAFAAKALHDHPDARRDIAREVAERGVRTDGPRAVAFAQEVRRTAPFVPMLPGRVTRDTTVDGRTVAEGGRLVLDILGTDLDGASWERPDDFDAERFLGVDAYEALPAFVPHGGADVATGHRCPGEKLAIAGLSVAVAALSDPRLEIPGEGLGVNRRRLPTRPASGGRVRRCPFH